MRFRYSEFSFDSATFDIDRSPLGCYDDGDTDAWDFAGRLVRDDAGFPSHDGFFDAPVAGRHHMSINIGSPIIGTSDGGGFRMTMGGVGTFLASNRPDVPLAPNAVQPAVSAASALATEEARLERGEP